MNTTACGSEHLSPESGANGRDANGRFAQGNGGGPGNPYARRVAELRQVMLECVTKEEMEIIVGELIVQAKCGKLAAIKLLFQYIIGKPPATVDPDTLDVQEVEQYRRAPEHKTLGEIVTARMPADVACDLLRGVTAYAGRVEANYIAESLLNPAPDLDEDDAEGDEPLPDRVPQTANSRGEPAPSPNGDSGADATRRKTTPSPEAMGNRAATGREERTSPRRPSAG